MTSTTIPTSRKLEIVDEACRILLSGGTKYFTADDREYYTHYICHALASAEVGLKGVGTLKFDDCRMVREFTKFAAELFGMVPLEDFTGINWEETKDEAAPEWWNSCLPCVEERVAHLESFKAWLSM